MTCWPSKPPPDGHSRLAVGRMAVARRLGVKAKSRDDGQGFRDRDRGVDAAAHAPHGSGTLVARLLVTDLRSCEREDVVGNGLSRFTVDDAETEEEGQLKSVAHVHVS